MFAKPKEGFDRPDHNDFATALELKERGFSGLRHNSITDAMEIWTEGDLRRSISRSELALNPDLLDTALAETFCLDDVSVAPMQGN